MFTKNKTNVCKGIGILFLLFHHLFRTPTMILNNNVDFGSMNIDTINIFATSLRVCVWIFAFLSAYGHLRLSISAHRKRKDIRSYQLNGST